MDLINKKYMTEEYLNVPTYVDRLSNWEEFDSSLPRGKVILNKSICGCGCTEAYLRNDMPVILASPRRELINCKMKKPDRERPLFYFDRSKSVDIKKTINQLGTYLYSPQPGFIPKVLVIYDSLKIVLDHLTQWNLLDPFTIVVDEFPCIFTDAKLKGQVELEMIRCLGRLSNHTVFVSATPIKDIYLEETEEFRNIPIVTLVWPPEKCRQIGLDCQTMRSTRSACREVIRGYKTSGYFKSTIVDGKTVYSTEALFFLNNVSDIIKIIKEFGLTPDDAIVICSEDNDSELRKVGFEVGHANDELNYKTQNKPFTFITKASFEGADFYSDCASTYVFADPGLESMGLDISIDLPQIAGRCRTDTNPFRNEITCFYKTSKNTDILKFEQNVNRRIAETNDFLMNYANIQGRAMLQKIRDAQKVQRYKNDYIDVIETLDETGEPIISVVENIYAKLADLRGIEILKSQYSTNYTVFVNVKKSGFSTTNPLAGENGNILNAFYSNFFSDNNFVRKMKLYIDFLDQYPALKSEIEAIPQIPMEYKNYYNGLKPERIRALDYREKAIKTEIEDNCFIPKIQSALATKLIFGQNYTSGQLKTIIQEVYDMLKIKRTAKGTDIEKYRPSAKKIIMTDTDGKRKKGYRI